MRLVLLALLLFGCEREDRRPGSPDNVRAEQPNVSTFPGQERPSDGTKIDPAMPGYRESAYDVSEGRTLYKAFNCVGCHAAGGGAIGPALMDRAWIYGNRPYDIAQSIIAGRPKGMPSYRGKLVPQQLNQLVAYVRSLGGFVSGNALSPRDDHSQKVQSPNLTNGGWPK